MRLSHIVVQNSGLVAPLAVGLRRRLRFLRTSRPPRRVPSARVKLLGEPGLDQGLIRHVALVGGQLDPLEQAHGQSKRDRGRRGSEAGQPHALGPAPVHAIAESRLSQKRRSSASLSKVGNGLVVLRIGCPLLAAHVAGRDHADPGSGAPRRVKVTCNRTVLVDSPEIVEGPLVHVVTNKPGKATGVWATAAHALNPGMTVVILRA
jgi:hypothetical protein